MHVRRLALILIPALCALPTGCVRSLAINAAADALTGTGGSFQSDDDPELVRDAIPFGLKVNESLIDAAPGNPKLLLAAAANFTQYAYAFLQQDADRLDEKDPEQAKHLLGRARRMYARARGYGILGLEARHEGFTAKLEKDRAAAVADCGKDDVPLLYWTAAAWAAEISITKTDAKLLGHLPDVDALIARALELDEAYASGSIHEFYVSWEAAKTDRDHVKRAKAHFDRALELADGKRMSPYLAWAEGIDVAQQNKKEFLQLVDKVLAFNPDEAPRFRLVNLITQDRARRVKARVDDLFAE